MGLSRRPDEIRLSSAIKRKKERNAGAIESGEKDDNGDGSHGHKNSKKYDNENRPHCHIFTKEKSSDVLISQEVALQVSSALRSLTTVFGMGTGVTSSLLSLHFLI